MAEETSSRPQCTEENDAITQDLPSTVDESLSSCPHFRIVLVGTSGVGKSSLVQSIFKIDLNAIDIAHDRAGRANIEQEYTSTENTRFILHDSQGFEAGSEENWNLVVRFLHERTKMKLADRVHAIWLCIQTPREGSRLQQTGDEKLLSLAKDLNIPVIVVFTKYDKLVKEQDAKAIRKRLDVSETEIEQNAENYFNDRIRDFKKSTPVSVVKVSTAEDYAGRFESLLELTKVTRRCLGDNDEAGALPFIIAQRVSTSQKVGLSIQEGFKKYWLNLGSSAFFQGRPLNQCVWRIHDDIIKVWNFNDPRKLLSGKKFFAEMILLVSPMLCDLEANTSQNDFGAMMAGIAAAVGPIIVSPAAPIAIALAAAGASGVIIKFLYEKYKQIPPTAQYLGAYITAITCVLHHLFLEIVVSDHSNTVSEDLISRMVAQYKGTQCFRHQNLIRDMGVIGFEKKIAKLIMEETHTSEMDSASAPQDSNAPHHSGGPSGEEQAETPGRNPERRPPAWKRFFAKKSSPST